MSRFDYIREMTRFEVIEEVQKFNPYHGKDGRFSTADGAASFTYKPGQGKMYDNAIAREKERQAAMGGKPKDGLVAGLGEEHAKAIEKTIHENAPEEVQKMWDKFGDDVVVADARHTGTPHFSADGIHVNIDADSVGTRLKNTDIQTRGKYQQTLHESGHAVDDLVSGRVGYDFATQHNGGKFESLLIQEANTYFKNYQKELQAQWGRKVNIDETRKQASMALFAQKDYQATGILSDILGGATKGKFRGTSGHDKEYWTGWKDYFGNVHGKHSVATEAFAHFTSLAANSKAATVLQSVFPESYNEFLSMCQFAASLN